MSALWRRLALGGGPGLISGAVMAAVPLMGALFLSPDQYAIWALLATLATVFLLFDFGAPALSTKLAAEARATRRTLLRILALTGTPPLLLGAGTAFFWPTYARIAGLDAFPESEVVTGIALVAAGSCIRSCAYVMASISLGRQHYRQRAMNLIVGSGANAGTTVIGLALGLGISALGLGLVAGGIAGLLVGLVSERHFDVDDWTQNATTNDLIKSFFLSKGAVTILGLTITQLDRWAIGLTGAEELLAQYDVLNRVVQIPKIALLSLLVGLVGETAFRTSQQLSALWRKTTAATLIVFLLMSAVLYPLSITIASQGSFDYGIVILASALVVVQLASSLTIPGTLIFAGIGRPQAELIYIVPLAVTVCVVYVIGVAQHDPLFIVAGWVVGMTAFSVAYVVGTPALIKRTRSV